MSLFLDHAKIEQIGWQEGRAVWITLAPLRYYSERLGKILLVPAEFHSDLASVPRLPFTWWLAGGRGLRPSLGHDFLYQFSYYLDTDGNRIPVTKAEADEDFHALLLADPISGAGPTIAQLMYRAVQLGGRGRWKQPARTASLNPVWTREGWLDAP